MAKRKKADKGADKVAAVPSSSSASTPPPPPQNPEHYAYIRAIVDCGDLTFEYQLNRPGAPPNRMAHDEDVTDWSESDIVKMARQLLDVDPSDPVKIEVGYA